jgi:predicted nucleic acid-binding protein
VRSAISPNDPRVAVLVAALDREDEPAAETWRRVGEAAERLGLRRPSYQHVRRLVKVERAARKVRGEEREVVKDALWAAAAGRVPSAVWTLKRLRALQRERELVLQEHKAFERRE